MNELKISGPAWSFGLNKAWSNIFSPQKEAQLKFVSYKEALLKVQKKNFI